MGDYVVRDQDDKELARVTYDKDGNVAILLPLYCDVLLRTDERGVWLSLVR